MVSSFYRNLFKKSMIRSAKAEGIIHFIKRYRKLIIVLSYLFLGIALLSYLLAQNADWSIISSYSIYVFLLASRATKGDSFSRDFWVEKLGGDGARVAAYLRVSTGKQAREGLSLEVQREMLKEMRDKLRPSVMYWFVDAGMSGEDFDRRKVKKILELRERREIDELWVTHIDRIGRECRRSLLFFLQFSEDGGIIRTPERTYSSKELADILVYAIESYGAQTENKRRAERATASKKQNFKNKKWNKPIPFGYCKNGSWIRKIGDHKYELMINELYKLFAKLHSYSKVTQRINAENKGVIDKPLTPAKVKRILSDPVYIGKPSHMGVSVTDESLRYVSDELFNTCQKIIGKTKETHKQRKIGPLAQFVLTYDVSALDFLADVIEFRHKGCGGLLVKNGTRISKYGLQQAYRCSKCHCQFRIPTKSIFEKINAKYQEQKTAKESKREKEAHQSYLDSYF